MTTNLIHDRGRGPELVGTRITVYNLLPDLLDPTATEAYICRIYNLTAEQVAAARAYILNNPDTVLAQHLKIEERIAAGNPPEVVEQMKRTHDTFMKFKKWLEERNAADAAEMASAKSNAGSARSPRIPSFREWLAQEDAGSVKAP
jgi:uncharacterized protein (DUF433 family)